MSDRVFYIGRFICIVIIVISVITHYGEIKADIKQNKKELKQLSDQIENLISETCNSCENPPRKFP